MRLKESEVEAISKTFVDIFEHGEIYLFGSRTDDTQRGGDIDLYVHSNSKKQLSSKKVDFLVKLKNKIGFQKVDLVIDRGSDRIIDKKAKETGILIWKS